MEPASGQHGDGNAHDAAHGTSHDTAHDTAHDAAHDDAFQHATATRDTTGAGTTIRGQHYARGILHTHGEKQGEQKLMLWDGQ
jgi:hypothetical protein